MASTYKKAGKGLPGEDAKAHAILRLRHRISRTSVFKTLAWMWGNGFSVKTLKVKYFLQGSRKQPRKGLASSEANSMTLPQVVKQQLRTSSTCGFFASPTCPFWSTSERPISIWLLGWIFRLTFWDVKLGFPRNLPKSEAFCRGATATKSRPVPYCAGDADSGWGVF